MADKKHPPQVEPAPEQSEEDSQMAGRIRESARQIWLAGLGAYTKAEGDAGRLFERLVSEGEEIESKTRGIVGRRVKAVEHRVEDVRDRATGTWDRLETLFDERVSGALRRLGIPHREEMEALQQRLAEVERELAELRETSGGSPVRNPGRDEEE
ncbi:poly(hydroxyalkanoate) granule-associated protein [Marinobacter daqiaonensis]|uniref:Poly(Hydroxyalkanoate) granule-associated protein n=1 Tax=Marinobacter daqiaonensis TaxID=650891 RepID=A0A1I6GU58_9GAMM|nr:phasin family protein [Marinobacter daqiaonensis]SFR45631.1 poly(hydroxyalkanoate) granule-associated protein [Marinobacter daqiaonensis]